MHRRLPLIALLLTLALPAAAGAQTPAPACPGADVVPSAETLASARSATLCLLNARRAQRGMAPLRAEHRLRAAAEAYSRAMVVHGFFDHVSPVDGSTLSLRVRATRYLAGVGSWSLGENIAWGTGVLATPAHMVDAWMASPVHRRNILTRRFREVGIGITIGAPMPLAFAPAATYTTDFGLRG